MAWKINKWLSGIEWRWSLWTLLQGTGIVSSFALPAWATHAANLFEEYQPLSWVVAGFIGLFLALFLYWGFQAARRIGVRTRFDEKFVEQKAGVNPLNRTFENQRIFLNTFCLPSHPIIRGKTFIDCEIIGPANLFMTKGNNINQTRAPIIDAVYLEPQKNFYNGFLLEDCLFVGCSFQRTTFFFGMHDYHIARGLEWINWITLTPDTPPLLAKAGETIEGLGQDADTQSPLGTEPEKPQ